MKPIYLDKEDEKLMIPIYEQLLLDVEEKRKRYIGILNQLKGKETASNQLPIRSNEKNIHSGYDKKAKWEDKVVFVLKELGKITQKAEIFEAMCVHEPELKAPEVLKGNRNSVGATLSRVANPDNNLSLRKKELSGSRIYYGLKEWFDEDGNVLSKYENE